MNLVSPRELTSLLIFIISIYYILLYHIVHKDSKTLSSFIFLWHRLLPYTIYRHFFLSFFLSFMGFTSTETMKLFKDGTGRAFCHTTI